MRARNLKPSLFKNEVLGSADPLLTLLFEGLWCEADREGRLEDRPLRLKAEIFPYRNDLDIDALLNWLSDKDFINRYEVGSVRVIQVVKFSDHQHPHTNEVASVLAPKDQSKSGQGRKRALPRGQVKPPTAVPLGLIPSSLIPDSGLLTPDSSSLRSDPECGERKAKKTKRLPTDFAMPSDDLAALAAELPADFDFEAEMKKIRDHQFREARSDWIATCRNWMRKARDDKRYARKAPKPGTGPPEAPRFQ